MRRSINATIHDISEESYDTRKSIASNPNTDVRTLSKLAEDENPWIRNCVAYNPNTPQDIAESLKTEKLMPKYAILVTYCGSDHWWYNDDWKDWVDADFDENVVLTGNDDFKSCESAAWYEDATSLIHELYYYDLDEFVDQFGDDYAEDKLRDIYEAYQKCRDETDVEFIAKIAMILYPGLHLETGVIHGNNQGDWMEYIYDTSSGVNINILEDWFFGNILESNIFELNPEDIVGDDLELDDLDASNLGDYASEVEGWDPITSTEYWEYSRGEGGVLKGLADRFGYPADECFLVEDD